LARIASGGRRGGRAGDAACGAGERGGVERVPLVVVLDPRLAAGAEQLGVQRERAEVQRDVHVGGLLVAVRDAAQLQRDRLRQQRAGRAGAGGRAVELDVQRHVDLRRTRLLLEARQQAGVGGGRAVAGARRGGRRRVRLLVAATAAGGDESE